MDLKLHRPQTSCATTGRPFAPGDVLYSALMRGPASLDRIDVSSEGWRGPPEQAIAWWKSRYPEPHAAGPTLAPPDVLLDALENLEDGADDPLRYLLALQLVRRRVLRIVDSTSDDPVAEEPAASITLACRKRDREYRVRVVDGAEVAAADVEARLAALLWSGEAA